jgi:hypothetical protein
MVPKVYEIGPLTCPGCHYKICMTYRCVAKDR